MKNLLIVLILIMYSVACSTEEISISPDDIKYKYVKLLPGDNLVFQEGNYDTYYSIESLGTDEAPTTVSSVEGSVFSGRSSFSIKGKYISLFNMKFLNGNQKLEYSGENVIELGKEGKPCNYCTVDNILIDNYNPIDDVYKKTWYVSTFGQYNNISNSTFLNKKGWGPLLQIDVNPEGDYHKISGNYFAHTPQVVYSDKKLNNEREGIRLGSSKSMGVNSFNIIEHNLFESINGEPELISIKSCNNIIRFNTLSGNKGGISLRQGGNNKVLNNIIDGKFISNSYGVRVTSVGNIIAGNYFMNLRGNRLDKAALVLRSGDYAPTSSGYVAAQGTIFAYNTLIDNDRHLVLNDEVNPVVPKGSYIFHNVIKNINGVVLEDNDVGFSRGYNVVDYGEGPVSIKLKAIQRVLAFTNTNGILRLNRPINTNSRAYIGIEGILTSDIDGHPINLYSVGADSEYQTKNWYLSEEDVGYKY